MENNTAEFFKITGLSKQYGLVKALEDVSFSVFKGEIHAILGENGAGKSTLVKIIMGEVVPDSGTIQLEGTIIKEYSPLYARSRGIQMVHQELAIFENMTVAENIFPWNEFQTKARTVDWKKLYEETRKRLDLFGLKNIAPDQLMKNLTLDIQQLSEILRCMTGTSKVLLLDEPSSGLSSKETAKFMTILRSLRDKGETILYISHRLKEIIEISDRVTILRDGHYIGTMVNDKNLTENILIDNMVGHNLSSSLYIKKKYKSFPKDNVLFEVKNLSKKNVIDNISFSINKGEILGIFGLEGSGADKLSRIMFGLEGKDSGKIFFKGKEIKKIVPSIMVENKILYMNNDRKTAGLLPEMSTVENIAMPILKKISKFFFIMFVKLQIISETYVKKFNIAIPSVKTKPRNLSGGNQQKVLLTVCLAAEPELLIANDPTRGIDVGTKAEIHRLLKEISEQEGVSIIVFSSELPELISIADRVIVMKKRVISGELSAEKINESTLMAFAAMETESIGREMA